MRATIAMQKHFADALGVGRELGAEVVRQPLAEARPAVPLQPVEIVSDGMKRAFVRALFDGLMNNVLADVNESAPLQKFLHGARVGIDRRPRHEVRNFTEQRLDQHGSAQHFIVGEHIAQRRIASHREHDIPEIACRLASGRHDLQTPAGVRTRFFDLPRNVVLRVGLVVNMLADCVATIEQHRGDRIVFVATPQHRVDREPDGARAIASKQILVRRS